MHRKRLALVLALLAHREPYEHELAHPADAVERQAQRLLPHGVEPVVLHHARLVRHHPRRRRARGGRGGGGSRRRSRRRGGMGGMGRRGRGRVRDARGARGGRDEGRLRPVRHVHGDLDERVDDGLVEHLAAVRVLRPGQLLRGDDLRVEGGEKSCQRGKPRKQNRMGDARSRRGSASSVCPGGPCPRTSAARGA